MNRGGKEYFKNHNNTLSQIKNTTEKIKKKYIYLTLFD